jgi:hypothetical protein
MISSRVAPSDRIRFTVASTSRMTAYSLARIVVDRVEIETSRPDLPSDVLRSSQLLVGVQLLVVILVSPPSRM